MIDFDTYTGTFYLNTTTGAYEVLVHKMSQTPVGVNEMISLNISNIFPNPTNDLINIEYYSSKQSKGKLEVMNLTGQVVHAENVNCNVSLNQKQISLKHFPQGIYLIRISTDEGVFSKRVIKN